MNSDTVLKTKDFFETRNFSDGELRNLMGRAGEHSALWIVRKWIDKKASLNNSKIKGTNVEGFGDLIIPDIRLSDGWMEVKSVSRGSNFVFRMDQHAGIAARGDVKYAILVHPRKLIQISKCSIDLVETFLNYSVMYIATSESILKLWKKFGKTKINKSKTDRKIKKRGWATYNWMIIPWQHLPKLLKEKDTQVFTAQVGAIPYPIGSYRDSDLEEFYK